MEGVNVSLVADEVRGAKRRGQASYVSPPTTSPASYFHQGFMTAASTRNKHFYGNKGTFFLPPALVMLAVCFSFEGGGTQPCSKP